MWSKKRLLMKLYITDEEKKSLDKKNNLFPKTMKGSSHWNKAILSKRKK